MWGDTEIGTTSEPIFIEASLKNRKNKIGLLVNSTGTDHFN